jgi:hypothetical protein
MCATLRFEKIIHGTLIYANIGNPLVGGVYGLQIDEAHDFSRLNFFWFAVT